MQRRRLAGWVLGAVGAVGSLLGGSRTSAAAAPPLQGLYVRGVTAARDDFDALLEKASRHGLNAIVLDAKDTDGLLTYPSQVALAVDTGATAHAPIKSLPKTIALVHARGLKVVMRVSCFHDEWMQHARPDLSIRGKAGGVYPIGWLDPANSGAHAYLLALAKEAIDAGADEIELDYVRYPVTGIKNADFHLKALGKSKTEVIRDFVREVHAVTLARGVPLSLDLFGVAATGSEGDIAGLGQDIHLLAQECEVISPMLYPSHYAKGTFGWDVPGDHPELVGFGTEGAQKKLAEAQEQLAVTSTRARPLATVRPWVQAMDYESPSYGPSYVAREVRSAREHGASGFLLWNPHQQFQDIWQAFKTTPTPPPAIALAPAPAPAPVTSTSSSSLTSTGRKQGGRGGERPARPSAAPQRERFASKGRVNTIVSSRR